jgi:predicted aspartyl protease
MGKVVVPARIVNVGDAYAAEHGMLPTDAVRFVDVPEALVDTGATGLSMPKSLLQRLGLKFLRDRPARTTMGVVQARMFGTARLTVQGRDCPCDVTEVSDDCPVLIGQIPLEAMDFVVDPSGQWLIGNPAHGGEHIIEL